MALKLSLDCPRESTSSILESEIAESLPEGLFFWTLTHRVAQFARAGIDFESRYLLIEYLNERTLGMEQVEAVFASKEAITAIALQRIEREWGSWVKAHDGRRLGPISLDNRLMSMLYPYVRKRDGNRCVRCQSGLGLTIHHIMPKRRNLSVPPRYGKSVPTNLVTLCKICHAKIEPRILD